MEDEQPEQEPPASTRSGPETGERHREVEPARGGGPRGRLTGVEAALAGPMAVRAMEKTRRLAMGRSSAVLSALRAFEAPSAQKVRMLGLSATSSTAAAFLQAGPPPGVLKALALAGPPPSVLKNITEHAAMAARIADISMGATSAQKVRMLGLSATSSTAAAFAGLGNLAAREALSAFASPVPRPSPFGDIVQADATELARVTAESAPRELDAFQRVCVANYVFVMVFLLLVSAWLREANRLDESLSEVNRVELVLTVVSMLSLSGGSWLLVMYPERVVSKALAVLDALLGSSDR